MQKKKEKKICREMVKHFLDVSKIKGEKKPSFNQGGIWDHLTRNDPRQVLVKTKYNKQKKLERQNEQMKRQQE